MSTGYGWEGIRQVYVTLLGARHVPEHLCGGPCLQKGRYNKCSIFYVLLRAVRSAEKHAQRDVKDNLC